MTALHVQQLVLRAGGPADAMTFSVEAGQVAALFGRPDSGIREVLRIIAGLEPAARGEVRLDDVPVNTIPVNRRRIGLVQRDAVLFPGTVEDNVAFGLKHSGWPKGDRGRRIAEVLELVGMTGAEGDRADALTEGERARVILARAMAPAPAALLVESPTWYVPDVDRITFRGRLRDVFQSLEVPVLISTNDVQDAVGIADDLLVMHDGRLRQSGSVSRVLAGPNSIEVAELVGYVTLIRGEVRDGQIVEPGAGAIDFPAGFPLRGAARALAHPAVMLGVPESSGLGCGVSGTLERVRAIGPTHLLDLHVGERTIEVRWEWDLNPPDADEAITIAVPPGTLRFFNEPARAAEVAPAVESDEDGAGVAAPAGEPDEDEPSRAEAVPVEGDTSDATDATPNHDATAPTEGLDEPDESATDIDETVEERAVGEAGSTPAVETPERMPVSEVREFRPSDTLMAEPGRERADSATIAYDPEGDSPIAHDMPGRAPAPAPSPPRSHPPEDERSGDGRSGDGGGDGRRQDVPDAEDDSVEAMAPWLQVSKPPGEDAPEPPPRDPHRGMPLD